MKSLLVTLAFDGSGFCGWQVQKNGESVCAAVQRAVETLLNEKTDITGCGRTDAGVHALGYRFGFRTQKDMDIQRFLRGFNALAPDSVRALSARFVPEDFHPRYSASGKTYLYRICNFHCLPPFERGRAYLCAQPLDTEKMRKAAGYFLGEHDFSAFRAAGAKPGDAVRTLYGIDISEADNIISIRLTGSGFLYKMARSIAGTLLEVGRGTLTPALAAEILDSRERARAGLTLPPQGLYLERVYYDCLGEGRE